ncbi:glucose-6-phosphate isomerase, partial [Clostridium botulinum]|nr:glucose-6-phosphate isomerase [Clostridium botulinum]
MENSLSLDLTKTKPYVEEHEIQYLESIIREMDNTLGKKTGPGNKFLGWMDLPINYNKEEFARIKKAAEKIKNTCDVFIVIGIGGSYLGSRAAIEMISNTFYNNLDKNQRRVPQIYFAGNNISSTYMADLLELVKDKDICVNVISKSGTTTEPAIAFRIFKELLEKKYGKEGAKERIFATTDA